MPCIVIHFPLPTGIGSKDAARGYACIAEQRCLATIGHGAAVTQFMRFGDTIRIEMLDEKGKSVFGAIEQEVTRRGGAAWLPCDGHCGEIARRYVQKFF